MSAVKLSKFFETKTRDNGETFTYMTDDCPEWLHDACGKAMHHCMSDWAYEACSAVASAIDEGEFDGRDYHDAIHEWADSYVDVYTRELAQWYADHCLTDIYAHGESEAEDMGAKESGNALDVNKILSIIQFGALRYLATVIVEAWRENQDSGDEDQESAEDDYAAAEKE